MLGIKLNVSNYSEMLSKLAWFAGINSFIVMTVIIKDIEIFRVIDQYLEEVEIPLLTYDISVAFFLSVIIAILTHIMRFHDRLSDLFRIRSRFDVDCIIVPLISMVGFKLPADGLNKIQNSRNKMMKELFYKYNSSGEGDDPIISGHTRKEALTSWSWYWVLLEGSVIFIIGALIALLIGSYFVASCFLLISVFMNFIMQYLFGEVRRYAWRQVSEISDKKNEEVHQVLGELF